MAPQSWIFDHQAYFIKAFVFTGAIKRLIEISFKSLSTSGTVTIFKKLYSPEKVCSLGMEEGISLKKDRNRGERGALMACIIVKEKNSKKFLTV